MKRMLIISLLAIAAVAVQAQTPALDSVRTYANRMLQNGEATGIVIALRERGKPDQMIALGHTDTSGKHPVTASTMYEAGSITKTFTSQLLAQAVVAGKIKLDDPIRTALPKELYNLPNGVPTITWRQLATHRSGLPGMPPDFADGVSANDPFAHYSNDRLWAVLKTVSLKPGNGFEYANLGMGLLGQLLARVEGKPYEELVRTRILAPLGLKATYFPSAEPPANPQTTALPDGGRGFVWHFTALAPAGAINSNAQDLLTYLEAQTQPPNALAAPIALARQQQTSGTTNLMGLGWMRMPSSAGDTVLWHNGGTAGTRAFAGTSLTTGRCAVVLINGTARPSEALGLYLLGASIAPALPPVLTKLDAALAPRYAGTYQLAPSFSIKVWVEGGRLYGQATGQPSFRMKPVQEAHKFQIEGVPAEVVFTVGETGPATQLTLYQNGQVIPGARVPG